jgi:ubiquinone/menaquinone biosynthesis C-methylase UbiE
MRPSAILLERQLEARLESERTRLGSSTLQDRVIELVQGRGERRGLDLGTGCGEFLERLRAAGIRAAGLDLCGKLLARGRRNATCTSELVQGDVERLPVASKRLDLVTCLLVAHYLKNPRRAFCEAARVLRPQGSFVLADRIASPDPRLREIQQRIETLRNPSVQRLLSSQELSEHLQRAGFRVQLVLFIEDALPLSEWLAGLDPERVSRIRQELLLAPPELGGLRFDAPDRIRLRIDLVLAQKLP